MDLSMKVLVVDDFPTMRRIITTILKQVGFTNIVEADDGSTALEVLKNDRIDLIISDWNMPNVTGMQLLKEVRADRDIKDIPFIMVTAEAQNENIVDAVRAGVSNYIIKPFKADTVTKKIQKVFGE